MSVPVAIIGAGAAGLATARELARRGVSFRILERGESAGQTWHDLYDSLRLHTGRHLSAMPGLRMPRGTPLFPTRLDYTAYLRAYAKHFDIPVECNVAVQSMTPHADGWNVVTSRERLAASVVVIATGIVSNPHTPAFAGRDEFERSGGTVLHSVQYRRPDRFTGQRVLVVGVGNSGGEVASELARAGVDVSIAVRSGANVVPLTIAGVPIQYLATIVRKLPRRAQERIVRAVRAAGERRRGPPVLPLPAHSALDAIPLIGFHLVDEIRAGRVHVRPGVEAMIEGGVRFFDGREEPYDAIILATGFRPALAPVAQHVQRDGRGFAVRADRVTSADHPNLFFVGHNYDSRGGLLNIAVDAPAAADRIATLLR